MPHPYEIWDVFTETPFAGNPLAVVFDADDLAPDAMQRIAAEFNLSETIFLAAPSDGANTHAARIFTPVDEMPFAGHPTVGGAVAAARRLGGADTIALELPAGVARCRTAPGRATITAPKRPALLPGVLAGDALARLFSLEVAQIGFGAFAPTRATSGPSWTIVPVADTRVLSALEPGGRSHGPLGEGFTNAYFVTDADEGEDAHYRARMFAPDAGIAEDPATGSAAVAFAALWAQATAAADGTHPISILQAVEMGRPSRLALAITVTGGAVTEVELTGSAVLVAEGRLLVP